MPFRAHCRFATAISFATLLSTPAAAQSLEELKRQIDELAAKIEQLEKAQQRVWTVEEAPSPRFVSPDGRFSMKLLGRLHIDAGWISDRNDTTAIRATELRTARFGVEGRAGRRVGFKLEGIFDEDSVTVKDAYISMTGPIEVRVGYFKVFTSLDEATSSKILGLMERAAFTDAFGFDGGLGIGVIAGGQSWSLQGGLQRGTAAHPGLEDLTVALRGTGATRVDGGILHLGASFRYRQADENASFFRYRQRAHNHLSPRFLDTGEFARQDLLWGLETAYILGPMTIQGEWSWLRAKPAAADNPLRFSGGYVGLNWIVTGEHRAYRAGRGSFGRIRVARPITTGGPGAFEVTVHVDHLDLSDGILRAGEQNTYIAGVNWYPVDHLRFMVNLARAEVRDAYVSGLNGANGSNRVNSLGMRAQIDW